MSISEEDMRKKIKDAVREIIEELIDKDEFSEIIEDIALKRAIDEGLKTEQVPEEKILKSLKKWKLNLKVCFLKDLKSIKDIKIKQRTKDLIEEIKEVKSIKNIKNLKKLKIGKNYYRINIFDYRIGMILESDNLIFVRILNRKDIYKYFP